MSDERELVDAMKAVLDLEDDFHEACSRLPRLSQIVEIIESMQAVIDLEPAFQEAARRINAEEVQP